MAILCTLNGKVLRGILILIIECSTWHDWRPELLWLLSLAPESLLKLRLMKIISQRLRRRLFVHRDCFSSLLFQENLYDFPTEQLHRCAVYAP
jgi:hypothetical protein